jgi:hypothetical protein
LVGWLFSSEFGFVFFCFDLGRMGGGLFGGGRGWPGTLYVDQTGLELTEILLILSPDYWN